MEYDFLLQQKNWFLLSNVLACTTNLHWDRCEKRRHWVYVERSKLLIRIGIRVEEVCIEGRGRVEEVLKR